MNKKIISDVIDRLILNLSKAKLAPKDENILAVQVTDQPNFPVYLTASNITDKNIDKAKIVSPQCLFDMIFSKMEEEE